MWAILTEDHAHVKDVCEKCGRDEGKTSIVGWHIYMVTTWQSDARRIADDLQETRFDDVLIAELLSRE